MKSRRTEILIETRERIFVRCLQRDIRTICALCQSETVFIAPERAAIELRVTTREIFRHVESDTIHFIETKDGLTLVCLNSLERLAETQANINLGEFIYADNPNKP